MNLVYCWEWDTFLSCNKSRQVFRKKQRSGRAIERRQKWDTPWVPATPSVRHYPHLWTNSRLRLEIFTFQWRSSTPSYCKVELPYILFSIRKRMYQLMLHWYQALASLFTIVLWLKPVAPPIIAKMYWASNIPHLQHTFQVRLSKQHSLALGVPSHDLQLVS